MGSEEHPLVSIIVLTWNRKTDAVECVHSVLNVTYPYYEIIVIDNHSTDGTPDAIEELFPEVKLIRNQADLMAGGGRNVGIEHAKGDLLFFVDGDNIVHPEIVTELIGVISSDKRIGIVGPKMYFWKEPRRIWFAGAEIDLRTSRTHYIGSNELDEGQHDQIRETGHFPNAFMVRREVIDQIGGFDAETYQMFYEESDLCERARRAGFRVVFVPSAKTWHKIPLPREFKAFRRGVGTDEKKRIYLFARNRIIFMRRFASGLDFLQFVSVYLPLLTFYYVCAHGRRLGHMTVFLRGVLDGLLERKGGYTKLWEERKRSTGI